MIDNGRRAPLRIPGVFAGTCGISRGVLAFVPIAGSKPQTARVGSLDGKPVRLIDVLQDANGVTWLARWEEIA